MVLSVRIRGSRCTYMWRVCGKASRFKMCLCLSVCDGRCLWQGLNRVWGMWKWAICMVQISPLMWAAGIVLAMQIDLKSSPHAIGDVCTAIILCQPYVHAYYQWKLPHSTDVRTYVSMLIMSCSGTPKWTPLGPWESVLNVRCPDFRDGIIHPYITLGQAGVSWLYRVSWFHGVHI